MSWLTRKKERLWTAHRKKCEIIAFVCEEAISRTKPGNVSEEQAAEIKHAADELRNAAAGLI